MKWLLNGPLNMVHPIDSLKTQIHSEIKHCCVSPEEAQEFCSGFR